MGKTGTREYERARARNRAARLRAKLPAPCLHCKRAKKLQARGLCSVCYDEPGVREQYPSSRPTPPRHEPTADELESLVARQMEKLPSWWADEVREQERLAARGLGPQLWWNAPVTERMVRVPLRLKRVSGH